MPAIRLAIVLEMNRRKGGETAEHSNVTCYKFLGLARKAKAAENASGFLRASESEVKNC